jgi:hypothetical protein
MRNKNNLIQSYTHASNQASSGEEELCLFFHTWNSAAEDAKP